MTTDELSKLSDEEANRRLAELMGHHIEDSNWPAIAIRDGHRYKIPDYCSDLNACAEVEKGLTDEQFYGPYASNLWFLIGGSGLERIRAKARQRTLALIATLS